MSSTHKPVGGATPPQRDRPGPALVAPGRRGGRHAGRCRVRIVTLAALATAAVVAAPPSATAALFGPCAPYAAVAGGGPVSVPSTVGERGVDDAICALEGRVLADIAAQRGIALDPLAAAEILAHGRDEVRAQLFVKLIQAANTPPGSRDAVQHGAVAWLLERVRDVRLTQATRALAEFHRWEVERCDYVPPPGFTYTAGPNQCGGSMTALFSGGPLPPPYEEFVRYGMALMYAELGGGAVGDTLANLSRDITNYVVGVAVSTGVVAASVVGVVAFDLVATLTKVFFGLAASVGVTEGTVVTSAGFGTVVGAPAAIVLAGIVIGVVRGVQVFEAADIAPELEGDILRAQLTDEATLITLLSSREGMSLALFAFATQTASDSPVPAGLAPPTDPPAGAPVLRTVLDGLAVITGPIVTYRVPGGGSDRAWLDRNWWVVDRGADGGPTEVHPVLVVLTPNGSVRYVRFTGDTFIVSAFDGGGIFACPGAGCVASPSFEYVATAGGVDVIARSSFAGVPPVIDSGPAVTGATVEGGQVTLTVTAHDPAGGPVTVVWTVESDNGAGGLASWEGAGATAVYDIARPGTHTVTVKVTNALGLVTTAGTSFFSTAVLSSQLTLTPENPATECKILGNVIAQVNPELLALANPIVVRLDVDDDGTYEAFATTNASGRAVLPIFRSLSRGPHLLRAQSVSFATGQILEETRELIVVDNAPPGPVDVELRYPDGTWGPPPVVDIFQPGFGLPRYGEGDEIRARVKVADPCGHAVDIYILWGWAVAQSNLQRIELIGAATPDQWYDVANVFADDFTYGLTPPVLIVARDAAGALSEARQLHFHVDNLAPTIDALAVTAEPGHRVHLRAQVGDAAGIGDLQEVTVDWGDGTQSQVALDASGSIEQPSLPVIASHEYAAAGPRTVTLRARDDHTTTTALQVVNVQGHAPGISVRDLDASSSSRIVIGVDDPDGDDAAAAVEIDWGDGSAPAAAVYDAAAGGFVGTHSYASAGTFRVVVSAVDESGVAAPDLIGHLSIEAVVPLIRYKTVAPKKDAGGAPIPGNVFPKGWAITLDDVHLDDGDRDDPENYVVHKARGLLVPVSKNFQSGPAQPDLRYIRYTIAPSKEGVGAAVKGVFPRAVKHRGRVWQLENTFGTIHVVSKRTTALLVPAHADLAEVSAPGEATHYLCYAIKPTADVTGQTPDAGRGTGKFVKGLQVFFEDGLFDDCALLKNGLTPSFAATAVEGKCLFDLTAPVEFCSPADKTAVEPPRDTNATIAESTAATDTGLLCYKARLAATFTSEAAAGLAGARVGDAIAPKQARHVKRRAKAGTAVHTAPGNWFPSPSLLDTIAHEAVCIPTQVHGVEARQ